MDLGWLDSTGQILIALIAFSALIFVHELGHYLAAKLVGVRVERFFLGFDAWGLALKKEIHGCIYGIGILPLGGYVKLAGQADDPREEKITGAPDELRSKPLYAQALVFISGVLMNILFGYLLLVVGFLHGIPFAPNVIGDVLPDSPAAVAGLRPGDRVLRIDDVEVVSFEDLYQYIVGHPEQWYTIEVERQGNGEGAAPRRERFRVRGLPSNLRGEITTIGVSAPFSRIVGQVGSSLASPDEKPLLEAIHPGDEILEVNGIPLPDPYHGHLFYHTIERLPGKTIPLRIRRKEGTDAQAQPIEKVVEVQVGGGGLCDVGLGIYAEVADVSPDSPAARAGLRPGHKIYGVLEEGKEVWLLGSDDLRNRTRACGFQPISLRLRRGEEEIVFEKIQPRYMGWNPRIPQEGDTFLGLLAEPAPDGFRVTEVLEEGPVAGKVLPGDLLLEVGTHRLNPSLPLGRQVDEASTRPIHLLVEGIPSSLVVLPQISQKNGVPRMGIILASRSEVSRVQKGSVAEKNGILPGSQLQQFLFSMDLKSMTIRWVDPEGNGRSVILATPPSILADPVAAGVKGYLPIELLPARQELRMDHLLPALKEAGRRTIEMSLAIYNLIHKMGTGQISLKAAGGPVLVFRSISAAADDGIGKTIWLVAFISINLAIFNLLPFPVLDGGHLLFLFLEWIQGGPPSERVREIAQYVGIVCLLALMLTVTGFDVFFWLKGQ